MAFLLFVHVFIMIIITEEIFRKNIISWEINVIFSIFQSTAHIYGGHSSHVTNVRFLHDDSRLLSTGGKDMAILQWQII